MVFTKVKKKMFIKVVLYFVFVLSFAAAVFGQTTNQNSPGELLAPKIIAKPLAKYTAAALTKKLEGEIWLRVTFLASGEIGEITDVTKKNRKKFAKYGLTAEAIKVARTIRFEPARRNGEPVTVTKTVVYHFKIY